MPSRALLIGINDYNSSHAPNLRGCHNDITNVRYILMNYFDFAPENISLLADASATKTRITMRQGWLFSGVQPGDHIVFYFSGHGSHIRDWDGDEEGRNLKDELDELICLYGMDWRNKETYFVDDELGKWTQQLPEGVNLTVILDCCHSGTATREVVPPPGFIPVTRESPIPSDMQPPLGHPVTTFPGGPAQALPWESRPVASRARSEIRFVEPPVDIRARIDERRPMKTRRLLRSVEMNHMLLTACRDDQTSVGDLIGGYYNGAFTYYLCKTIRDVSVQLTYNEIIGYVRQSLLFNGYVQVPQCEGPRADEQIFARGQERIGKSSKSSKAKKSS